MRWTCGPFAKAERDAELFVFRAVQQQKLQDILSEIEKLNSFMEEGSTEEKLIGSMMELDLEQKLCILLGVDDGQTKNSEISRKTVSEFIAKRSKT